MKVFNVVLKKIESNHNKVRTDEVAGKTTELPEEGKPFSLIGDSLDPNKTLRWVQTTEIKELTQQDGSYEFKTQNSTYQLVVLSTEEID